MQFNCIKMSQYFPKSFRTFGGNINVKVDLSNYATKTDLKNSKFALKTNLASLKTKGDKLYVKWKGYDNRFNSRTDKKDLI